MRAYSHQGHGPRADQTGRIHISDFRNPRTISLAKRSRSIHWGQALSDYPPLQCRCRSRARASLRNRRQVLPSWDSRTRRNNLLGGLAVNRMAGPSGHANSPHPSSREGHLSTSRWSSSFLLSGFILNGLHAVAACSRVHRNSVPSTQMRCMTTASRRARATIALFIPRRLAICMAQALSQDHFFECIMLCAAS
jgi:hypothetical protein